LKNIKQKQLSSTKVNLELLRSPQKIILYGQVVHEAAFYRFLRILDKKWPLDTLRLAHHSGRS